jgi:MFS family permease
VTIALTTIGVALFVLAAVDEAWGLWVAAAVIGLGMAFMYPSLMASVVDHVDERERASALSSFTMFFELGTIVGGLVLGLVGELLGKRAGFVGGAALCAIGLVALWTRVASSRPSAVRAVAGEFVPVAGD